MIRDLGTAQPEPKTSALGLAEDTCKVACLLPQVLPEVLHDRGSKMNFCMEGPEQN